MADMLESWKSASDERSRPIVINSRGFGKRSGRKLRHRNTHASLNRYWLAKLLVRCRWSTWSQRPAMGDYSALLRSTCDRTRMAAVRRGRLVIWRAGMSPRRHGAAVSAANCFLQRKIGRGVTGASKWLRIHGLTTNSRRPATKLWALRLLTGASTIAKRFSFSLPIGNEKSAKCLRLRLVQCRCDH
jgi:hypothetical protein